MAAIAQTRQHRLSCKGCPLCRKLEAVADRGYYCGEEILACDKAGIAVTLPKPMTSGLAPGIRSTSPPQGYFLRGQDLKATSDFTLDELRHRAGSFWHQLYLYEPRELSREYSLSTKFREHQPRDCRRVSSRRHGVSFAQINLALRTALGV
jgi:hypothetical protein